jgi:hypothetical protein
MDDDACVHSTHFNAYDVWGGADKPLAWPERKQATATNSEFIQYAPNEAQYTS